MKTAEEFSVNWCMHPNCSGGDRNSPCCQVLTNAIRERDREVALWVLDELAAQQRVQRSEEHRSPGDAARDLRQRIERGEVFK